MSTQSITPTSVRLTHEEAEEIRASGSQNCRSLSGEIRFRAITWADMKNRAEKAEQALQEMLLGGQAQQRS